MNIYITEFLNVLPYILTALSLGFLAYVLYCLSHVRFERNYKKTISESGEDIFKEWSITYKTKDEERVIR